MEEIKDVIKTGLYAYAAKDLLTSVLGPTAEYIGQETKNLVKKCNINLSKIFKIAYEKLKSNEVDIGAVNLRVFKEIVSEGKFSEDILFQEYYGGILASSKTKDGIDDRGTFYISLIKGLSSYQLRLHYLIYLKIAIYYHNYKYVTLERLVDRENLKIYIPKSKLIEIFQESESEIIYQLSIHSMVGLREKQLIAQKPVFVDGSSSPIFKIIQGKGMVVTPTLLGCEMFLWGNGLGKYPGSRIGNIRLSEVKKLYDTHDLIITS